MGRRLAIELIEAEQFDLAESVSEEREHADSIIHKLHGSAPGIDRRPARVAGDRARRLRRRRGRAAPGRAGAAGGHRLRRLARAPRNPAGGRAQGLRRGGRDDRDEDWHEPLSPLHVRERGPRGLRPPWWFEFKYHGGIVRETTEQEQPAQSGTRRDQAPRRDGRQGHRHRQAQASAAEGAPRRLSGVGARRPSRDRRGEGRAHPADAARGGRRQAGSTR